jgi:hypothetical protein
MKLPKANLWATKTRHILTAINLESDTIKSGDRKFSFTIESNDQKILVATRLATKKFQSLQNW